jgi:hypothetical protein
MQRTAQELLLGITGRRALNCLGVPISTYHFNERHVVFAGVKMIAERMETRRSFAEAWADARRRIAFTTHTLAKAGNEEHLSRTCAARARASSSRGPRRAAMAAASSHGCGDRGTTGPPSSEFVPVKAPRSDRIRQR